MIPNIRCDRIFPNEIAYNFTSENVFATTRQLLLNEVVLTALAIKMSAQ